MAARGRGVVVNIIGAGGKVASPTSEIVVFLASAKASYVTGATLSMDGRRIRWFCSRARLKRSQDHRPRL